jgi:predicted Fe-S protein YdhL (DUF1289 family)
MRVAPMPPVKEGVDRHAEAHNRPMSPDLSIANPCINICRMDLAGKYCQGCGRTLMEIGGWDRMTEAERAEVTAILPARLPRRSGQSLAPQA